MALCGWLLAERKQGPAVHNSWQVFLLLSELLSLLSAFRSVLKGFFFLLELIA